MYFSSKFPKEKVASHSTFVHKRHLTINKENYNFWPQTNAVVLLSFKIWRTFLLVCSPFLLWQSKVAIRIMIYLKITGFSPTVTEIGNWNFPIFGAKIQIWIARFVFKLKWKNKITILELLAQKIKLHVSHFLRENWHNLTLNCLI